MLVGLNALLTVMPLLTVKVVETLAALVTPSVVVSALAARLLLKLETPVPTTLTWK